MFVVSPEPIDSDTRRSALADERAGACVTFEGWVRDRNDGRLVKSLEYEAYRPLAEKEGERILAEAREKFSVINCAAVHRVGHLQVGDLAVWAGVTAEHREAAFEACRYIINEAKLRVPIWKKEYYRDGASAWINSSNRGQQTSAVENEASG